MTSSHPRHNPEEEIAFERGKRRAAGVFLLAVLVMLVISGIIVYVLLQYRPA